MISTGPGESASAAGQPPFTASARLVCQAIVVKDRLFVSRKQLAIGLDRRCVLHLLPVEGDLEITRTDSRPVKGHEHQSVPANHPDLDCAEGREVGTGVNVDG